MMRNNKRPVRSNIAKLNGITSRIAKVPKASVKIATDESEMISDSLAGLLKFMLFFRIGFLLEFFMLDDPCFKVKHNFFRNILIVVTNTLQLSDDGKQL